MSHEAQEIELNIEEAQGFIKLQEAVDRLSKNKDFQKVILEEYFKNEPVRFTEALSSPNLQAQEHQDAIMKALSGIGQLQQFLNKVAYQADMAERAIEDNNEELSRIHDEAGEIH